MTRAWRSGLRFALLLVLILVAYIALPLLWLGFQVKRTLVRA